MQALDEFKTILALAGNKRLLHMEDEIFADNELTRLYLHNLCKDYEWYYPLEPLELNDTELVEQRNGINAESYAEYIMRERWYAAENVIKCSRAWYGFYCNRFNIP